MSTTLALACMFGLLVVFWVIYHGTKEYDSKIKKKPNPIKEKPDPKVISYADMPISAILCIAAANSKPENQKYVSDWAYKQLQWEREQQNDSK